MKVEISDYGFSADENKYYITYHVSVISPEELDKLRDRLEDPVIWEDNSFYLTTYYDEGFYPFGSEEFNRKPEDFKSREEIEMMAYIISLLED